MKRYLYNISNLMLVLLISINISLAQTFGVVNGINDMSTVSGSTVINTPLSNGDYTLTFSDEFDGATMDNKKWQEALNDPSGLIMDQNGVYGGVAYQASFAEKPDLFVLSNGTLKMYAKQIDEWHNAVSWNTDPNFLLNDNLPNRRHYKYASANLKSYRNFKYGFYEMSCKIPTIDGVWPAFWLYGQEGKTEIDIFEFAQDKTGDCTAESAAVAGTRWYATLHDWKDPVDNQHKTNQKKILSSNALYVENWHRFGITWDDFKIIWLFDGTPVVAIYHYFDANNSPLTSAAQTVNPYSENRNFPGDKTGLGEQSNIIFGMGMANFGGPYGDGAFETVDQTCTSSSAIFPKALEIDWIRVYEDRSCQQNVTVECSQFLPSLLSSGKNLILANNNCDVAVRNSRPDFNQYPTAAGVVKYAHTVYATANEKILMQPGFRVEAGAGFTANIASCSGTIPWGVAGAKIDESERADTTSAFIKRIKNYVDSIAVSKGKVELGPEDLIPVKETKVPSDVMSIKIAPNPNNGAFNVETTLPTQKVQLFDMLGTLVFETNSIENDINVVVRNYSMGIYIIKITDLNGTTYTNKISIQ